MGPDVSHDVSQWKTFLDRCLHARVPGPKFESFAIAQTSKRPVPSSIVADVLLQPKAPAAAGFDPLIPVYVERLLARGLLQVSDLLRTLLRTSRLHRSSGANDGTTADGKPDDKSSWHNPPELDEMLLFRVTRNLTMDQSARNKQELLATLKAASNWMATIVASSTRDEMMQDIGGNPTHVAPESLATREAVGMLVVALADDPRTAVFMADQSPKDLRRSFAHALSLFIPCLSHTSIQIGTRLENFQRQYNIFDDSPAKGLGNILGNVDVGGLQMQGMDSVSMVDGPVTHSRAGLYIYLNALLVGRPMVDDERILHYLQVRYDGNTSNMTIDLITAAFDVLSNATFRNEGRQTLFLFRSFLMNKIPLLVLALSASMFPPMTAEFCITQAMNHIDPQAFPSFSSSFDMDSDGDIFSDVRQEFLYACCLHKLIPEENIERLLGDVPMQGLPAGGRYVKEELVSQCAADPERTEVLLGEIEALDGNAGAVASAITEVIHTLCTNRETLTLKPICMTLASKPKALDVMTLFHSPASTLQPVCELLDSWRYEEDQGEQQPVYQEFGCILLLVLAFTHRYNLTSQELGVSGDDSFIVQLLAKGSASQSLESLSEDQKKHLGGWIGMLFDSEGGISDDLISSCPIQAFYLLVPTVFNQSVLACHAKFVDIEVFRGGLEFLLEAFLLPSLIGALTWLTNHLWEAHGDVDTVMQILRALVTPSARAGDAETMHHTILSLVGKPLEHALRELRRREPARADIDPLLQALQPHLAFRRGAASHHAELEAWTATPGGGLALSLRNTIQSLVLWSQSPELTMAPASYTHRQLLVAVRVLGARPVLRTLLDELKLQAQSGSADLALDIATALVCAPSPADAAAAAAPPQNNMLGRAAPGRHRLSLRDALRLEAAAAAADPTRADAVGRLQRRVAAQSADVGPVVSADMMHELDVAAAAAVVADQAVADGVAMGMDLGAPPAAGDIDAVLGEAEVGLMGMTDMDLS